MEATSRSNIALPCYEAITGCRACGSQLFNNVLDLGMQALPNFTKTSPSWEYAPLELVQCSGCGLVQLRHTVIRDRLFRTYFYRSGGSETMKKSLADLATAAYGAAELEPDSIVVDIGANDGTFLRLLTEVDMSLRQADMSHLLLMAFEPALNLSPETPHCMVVRDYFTAKRYQETGWSRANLIVSSAMFYSVADPQAFVEDISQVLAPSGVWVLEMSDLQALVDNTGFDIIGHEHVAVWSLGALSRLLENHGLSAWYATRTPTNGGSLRVYVSHAGTRTIDPSVAEQVLREATLPLNQVKQRVEEICEALRLELRHIRRDEKEVYLYAASTRGCTVLQAIGANRWMISGAAERDTRKIGKLVPGTDIPIVTEEAMRQTKPDYLLTMSPYYLPQFLAREHEFISRGGEFLVVFPSVHKVGAG